MLVVNPAKLMVASVLYDFVLAEISPKLFSLRIQLIETERGSARRLATYSFAKGYELPMNCVYGTELLYQRDSGSLVFPNTFGRLLQAQIW